MKAVNFASCNIDYVYSLDHIVRPGETEGSEKLEIFPGGKGLNQTVALSLAGMEVYPAAIIGEDG
ncbi:MAG: ribokinase, partial [Clostridia bacterium]|nr:ribokinase [Clostridia bacterium]